MNLPPPSEALPAQLLTLWIGPELSFLERACLRSALACGHPVALYCYDVPLGVPAGIELRNAAEILPESRIIRHRNGSPALFANLFRYELLRRNLGIWIDCDLYFIAQLPHMHGYIMGEQGGGTINNAVMRLPPDSAVLASLLDLFAERSVPPWLPVRSRLAAHWRLLTTGRSGLAHMPWGSAGPEALTWLSKVHGVANQALPVTRFYPVHWTEAEWILDPHQALEAKISHDTIAVHLWNERLDKAALASAALGSFAARLCQEGAPE